MNDTLLVIFTIETDSFQDTVEAINAIDAKNLPHVVGGGITLLRGEMADFIQTALNDLKEISEQ